MIKPMPPYFLVRVPRQEQINRKNKIGSIFLHPGFVYLTRGMQCGEIVSIGAKAHDMLPEAQIGHMLLFHHFVEAPDKCQCVAVDPHYFYYVVTAMSHNGQQNQTYGVWDGAKIIPHYDYLFLAVPAPPNSSIPLEQQVDANLQKNQSGLFLFKEWSINREELRLRMEELKKQIESLSKSLSNPNRNPHMNDQVMRQMKILEEEMNEISRKLYAKKYQRFTLVAAHPDFIDYVYECFGTVLTPGNKLYMLNIACETKMEFNGQEYIVAKSQHFGCTVSFAESVKDGRRQHAHADNGTLAVS